MKDSLEEFFEQHKSEFDQNDPPLGHIQRFEQKLKANKSTQRPGKRTISLYVKYAGIAASILLLLACAWIFATSMQSNEPQYAKAESHFAQLVSQELKSLEVYTSPQQKEIIADAMKNFEKLEEEHERLKSELKRTNGNSRVIQALIQNYQQKIDFLNNLQHQIQQSKQSSHENNVRTENM